MYVIYRVTSIPSTNPSPIFQGEKNTLNEVCLLSFVRAFKDILPEMIFLFDHCDESMYEIVERLVPFNYEIHESKMGINDTMLKSYEIAATLQGTILFQECDYFYNLLSQPIGKLYEQAIQELEFVSPYDHRNFYNKTDLHKDMVTLRLIQDHHFRTTERNTMTWGTMAHLIREHREIFDRYGYLDGQVWYDLKDQGHNLWVPIPSFATHMVKDYLAPGIKWEEQWNTL